MRNFSKECNFFDDVKGIFQKKKKIIPKCFLVLFPTRKRKYFARRDSHAVMKQKNAKITVQHILIGIDNVP